MGQKERLEQVTAKLLEETPIPVMIRGTLKVLSQQYLSQLNDEQVAEYIGVIRGLLDYVEKGNQTE